MQQMLGHFRSHPETHQGVNSDLVQCLFFFPMAHIVPFRAFRYDRRRVNPGHCVTQPYDKITPTMQESYYRADPHNLVRITLGKREPDATDNNVDTRAAAYFRDWRREGARLQD